MKELLAALDLETIPQLSLGTAALLIFGACALLVIVRGIFRILFGSLVLCASGFAGYLTWKNTPLMTQDGSFHWVSFVPAAIVGLVVLLLLRWIMRFLAKPLGRKEEGEPARRSPLRWVVTLLFSLIPTSVLWVGGATALRSVGSVAEIRRFADGDAATDRSAFLAALKSAIDKTLPEGWFKKIDPLSDDARVTLAKLIALGDSEPPPKAIPVLEEPQIRSLIEHDPHLRSLARSKRYADILRDPRLDNVIADPDLSAMLAGLNL